MKKIIFLTLVIISISSIYSEVKLDNKINQFVLNQKQYLKYTPKSIDEKREMSSGIGLIDTINTLYYKNLILYRKNNLPNNRKPTYFIYYTFIKYQDSIQCKEALLKWLSCFGDCTKIKYKEDKIGLHTQPMFIIFNTDEIIIAQTQCEMYYNSVNPKNKSELWKNVIDDFIKYFANSNSTYIDVGCGGPLIWSNR